MAEELVRFDEFELDRAACQLRRKGRAVRLERIPLDLLLFLLERRGELVTREEIRNRIWGEHVFVDAESSINTAIRKLRRVLRDRPRSPRFIQTVATRGYRFIAAANEAASRDTLISKSESRFLEHGSNIIQLTEGQASERRHLTVLFCELIPANLTSPADPEELWENIVGYQRAAVQEIERYGGHLGPCRGDAMTVYFGWPAAHDNDAERAVLASLAITEAVARLNEKSSRRKVSARIGIDSGTVVVAAREKSFNVFGDSPNIAARVEEIAVSGTVMITAATERLISGLFVVEDCGSQVLRGIEPPVQLYRIVKPSGVRGRLAAVAVARGLTPFVGREDELRLLVNHWQRTLDGEGQAALIIGEPGIGKSRLVQHFRQQLAGTLHTWVETAAHPLFQNTPFYPVSELLRQILSVASGEPPEDRLAELESALERVRQKPAEVIPLIAPLLNLPVPERYSPTGSSADRQRRRLLATLVESVCGTARAQPLVIAVEDLHWADPSTLELLELLLKQVATVPLLLLYTARPEFCPQWTPRARHIHITLSTLTSRDVRVMIGHLTQRHEALSDETIATVVDRTGGVPLFVEELTRAVLESSDDNTNRQIPATLHDSLMARLDRLGSAKIVLQLGSVIGGEFYYELLRAVHPGSESELESELGKLTEADLLYVRGIPPDATYRFKHTLIRDAAYEALLKSRRKELHGLIGRTIDQKFSDIKEAHPEVLARHWVEAGETAQAIAAWTRAGKAAESHHAFKEAQRSYEQTLVLLSLLPDSAERDLHELDLRQSIIRMLWVTSGIASPESVDACGRAIALAKKSGNLSQLVSLMNATGHAAFVAGDYESAATLADQALELAVCEGNPTNLGPAYQLQVSVRFFRGDLLGTEEHFAQGFKFFEDPAIWPFPLFRLEALGLASWNAWMLGRADLAHKRLARMMAEANQNNPAEVAWSGCLSAGFYLLLREHERAETLAAWALELFEKHQISYFAQYARCVFGWARAWLGRPSDGVALIRQAIASMAAMGTHNDFFTLFLAESQALSGANDDALETIEQVLQPNRLDANINRPEAFRLRGELQTKQGRRESAEADFREALRLARRMGAKTLELRAAMSLARLLRDIGRRNEARNTLAQIYDWFIEGFDLPDLKDAMQLLEELGT